MTQLTIIKSALTAAQTPSEAQKILNRHGFKKVGQGGYKKAYAHPKTDYIVKVYFDDSQKDSFGDKFEDVDDGKDAWDDLCQFADENALRENVVPFIESMEPAFVFQKRVTNVKFCENFNCYLVAERLSIADWKRNHGHDDTGKPLFYDGQFGVTQYKV